MRKVSNLIFLPLHVWDREFDSRLILSYVLAQLGYSSLIGHEYSIASLYPLTDHCLLFRAGGPLDHPVRGKWHSIVHSQNGFVATQDEEGINNLHFERDTNQNFLLQESKIEKVSISPQALQDVDLQIAWGQAHRTKLIKQCLSLESQNLASKKINIASPFRFNSLASLGELINSEFSISSKTIFGSYILALDNFSVDHIGQIGIRNDALDAQKAGLSDETIKQRAISYSASRDLDISAREDFSQILLRLASKNPSINFILRPHPLLSSYFWHKKFSDVRNIHVISSGSVIPWIYGSLCTIHSGCTTGLEALACNRQAFDVTKVLSPRSQDISRSFISNSNYCVESLQDLDSRISDIISARNSRPSPNPDFKVSNDISGMKNLFDKNALMVGDNLRKSISIHNFSEILSGQSSVSMLLDIVSKHITPNTNISPSIPSLLHNNISNLPPNVTKSRHVSSDEVRIRLRAIKRALSTYTLSPRPISVCKLSTNTFMLAPSQ